MAHDEELAERVRGALGALGGVIGAERRMFSGLAFMVESRMAVCVSGQGGLLLRAANAEQAAAWRDQEPDREHVGPMRMGARTSDTWVHVTGPALTDDADLERWVACGLAGSRAASR